MTDAVREVVETVLKARGYESLNPTQRRAVESGLLKDEANFVAASPTASGKTIIGELAIIDAVRKFKKGVYLVPLRSLGYEKAEDFSKYSGYRIALRTGDYDSKEEELGDYDIIISTYEKWDSILRHRPAWLPTVGCVVADEGHMLTDGSRGSTIEVLLTRMIHKKIRVVILSAVLRNVNDVASWLKARFMESDWRPTPLRKGVYLFRKGDRRGEGPESSLEFEDGTRVTVDDSCGGAISNLVHETLKEGGQCLVFARGRKEAVRVALSLRSVVEVGLTPADILELSRLSSSGELQGEDEETSKRLEACVASGVGFHHAGLATEQKSSVEKLFREMKLKVVCSTPTLSQGVNLPARRVIIQTVKRFDSKLGWMTIPRWEFENEAGRAGRPRYDRFGEAIVLAKERKQQRQILRYIKRPIEELDSKLITAPFYSHVLSEICLADSTNTREVQDFFRKTFAAYVGGEKFVAGKVVEIIEFLVATGLVKAEGERFGGLVKTPLGERISRLYISPLSVPMVVRALETCESRRVESVGWLHMICCMDDWKPLILTEGNKKLVKLPEEQLIVDVKLAEARYELAMRPASMMQQRIDEVDLTTICERFEIGEGDIHSATEAAEWLAYSVREVAKFTGHFSAIPALETLDRRVNKGVKEELLSLTTIRNIGARRARLLFAQGVKTKEDFERLSDTERDRLLGFHFKARFSRPVQTNLTDFWS